MDSELERFKTEIDLRAYAAGQGFQLDRKESSAGSSVMRHPDGDKIVVKRDAASRHYVYFSIHRAGDTGGSIIDFVQNRQRLNLGAVRKELRPWIGMPSMALPVFPVLHKTSKDRLLVETAYATMDETRRHPYLENERGIPRDVLELERFAGRIRIGGRGNAVFPHFDRLGLCGYEIKNTGFTGFATGGSKGLWSSNERPDDNRLVFCEVAIDALSYAALFPDDRARYASVAGKLNPEQPELIRMASANMPAKSKIVAAMDADEEGGKLAEVVREAVLRSGRDDLSFVFHEPVGFKDWNDQLRGTTHSLPNASRSLSSLEA